MSVSLRVAAGMAVLGAVVLVAGCEWEASDTFNTSQGAGVNINFSGVYTPDEGEYVTGTNITSLVLNQIGNRVEVQDNNGVNYTGTIGSPNVQTSPDENGVYAPGANLLQAQINFASEGLPQTIHDNIQFIGIVRAIAVTQVQSTETTLTIDEGELQQETTRTFTVDQGNTRYIIQGNWTVGNMTTQGFSAWAPAQDGSFTTAGAAGTTTADAGAGG